MEFYQAVSNRRTVREFSDKAVPQEVMDRILNAGLQAPTNDHMRNWEFVILQEQRDKENALCFVEEWAKKQGENKNISSTASPAQKMYAYAMPRQYTMLESCSCVVLPFFKPGTAEPRFSSLSTLNGFASIWCVIENIFLAVSAEGLACSMRIPVGAEAEQVAKAVNAPHGYVMPCYIGIGYSADEAHELEQHSYTVQQKTHYGTW